MPKTWRVILTVSLAVNLVLGYLLYNESDPVNSDSKQFIEKIDSLESELITLQEHRDKVKEEIDTVYIQLENIDKEYVETRNSVIANSPDDDYCFFIEYLKRNKARLDSIDNF